MWRINSMKFHVLKPDFDNEEMVKVYTSSEDFNKQTVRECLYGIGKTEQWEPGFYMIASYENDKYVELLGCYAHSTDFEIALYFDKVPPVVNEVWENLVKGEKIIQ